MGQKLHIHSLDINPKDAKGEPAVPRVSVVMPTYNDALYLRDAIDSILNQTFTDFEFIIVNDGSADDTERIILSYEDKRIRYLKNEVNAGNTVARNKGMEAARGRYIAIMDSDDVSVPDRLETQYKYMERHPGIGILGGAKIFFDERVFFSLKMQLASLPSC
jgi:glycosyltransferase involved in cell wall biosynthesis